VSVAKALANARAASLKRAAEEVQQKAIELAPFKTGRLENSSSIQYTETTAVVGFDTEYAAIVHELPEHAHGPGTLAKPGNELGPAGSKYLERPLLAMQERAKVIVTEEFERALKAEPQVVKRVPLGQVAQVIEEIVGTVEDVVGVLAEAVVL
jgi:phage gpG-like protein